MAETQPSTQNAGLSLAGILDVDHDEDSYPVENMADEKAEGWDEENGVHAREGYCIECEGPLLPSCPGAYTYEYS